MYAPKSKSRYYLFLLLAMLSNKSKLLLCLGKFKSHLDYRYLLGRCYNRFFFITFINKNTHDANKLLVNRKN